MMGPAAWILLLLSAPGDAGTAGDAALPLPPAAPRAMSRADQDAFFRRATVAELIALGRRSLPALGLYRARMTKQERVGGKLLAPQVIDVTVRPQPLALRLDYVSGPKAGRRVLYNAELKKGEMLAREAGLLGFTSVWVGLNSGLARGDTNHRVTELGFAPLLDLIERHLVTGRRLDEGFDAAGAFCLQFTAPPGVTGLYADRTRFCIDPALGLPVKIEVFDKKGILEKYEYNAVRSSQSVPPSYFTPAGAGL